MCVKIPSQPVKALGSEVSVQRSRVVWSLTCLPVSVTHRSLRGNSKGGLVLACLAYRPGYFSILFSSMHEELNAEHCLCFTWRHLSGTTYNQSKLSKKTVQILRNFKRRNSVRTPFLNRQLLIQTISWRQLYILHMLYI